MFEWMATPDLKDKLDRYEVSLADTIQKIEGMKAELYRRHEQAHSVMQPCYSTPEGVAPGATVTGSAQDRMNELGMTVADVRMYTGAKEPFTLAEVERTLHLIEKGVKPRYSPTGYDAKKAVK